MSEIIDSIGVVPKKIRKKRKNQDPNAPKRPRSAFLWFCDTYRSSIQLRYPNLHGSNVLKVLGYMWRESSPEKKNAFKSLASQDRVKYLRDCEEYRQNNCEIPRNDGKMVTPAMKKQKFDFPSEAISVSVIPDLGKCGINYVPEDGLVVEDLGFIDLLSEGESANFKEIAVEQVTNSDKDMKYYEVHVVKTPEKLKNTGYDLVIPDKPPQKLFESQESDTEVEVKEESEAFDEMPDLEDAPHNVSCDSMPELERQI